MICSPFWIEKKETLHEIDGRWSFCVTGFTKHLILSRFFLIQFDSVHRSSTNQASMNRKVTGIVHIDGASNDAWIHQDKLKNCDHTLHESNLWHSHDSLQHTLNQCKQVMSRYRHCSIIFSEEHWNKFQHFFPYPLERWQILGYASKEKKTRKEK